MVKDPKNHLLRMYTSLTIKIRCFMSQSDFGNLLFKHESFLYQLAMKLTRSLEDSNDLIQETYFKALKSRDKFKEGTNLKGWLYTIMRNTFINAYRKEKNQNTFVDETDSNYFIDSTVVHKTTNAESKLEQDYLMEQINSIEKPYVDTFMLYFNGYKYDEIAEKLNVPLGTVKSRIFLARKKMMSKLKDYNN